MNLGLKRRILIDADSGRLRYVLWFFGSIFHKVFTFIQIGSGHTVTSLAKEKSHVTIFFQKQDTTLSSLCLWNQSSAESVISNSLGQQKFCLHWPWIGMAIPGKISLLGESRHGNLTFLVDRGRSSVFLRVSGEFQGIRNIFLNLPAYYKRRWSFNVQVVTKSYYDLKTSQK